jgi:hypothetical protein
MKRLVSSPLYGIAAALLLAACVGMASAGGQVRAKRKFRETAYRAGRWLGRCAGGRAAHWSSALIP